MVKSFIKKQYAKDHCKTKAPWICPNCSAEIANAQNIKRHTEKCRQAKPKVPENLLQEIKCEVCNKGFHNKYNLRRHKLVAHKIMESNTLVCDAKTCPFTTKDTAQLKRHKTLNHSKKAVFECSQCGHKLLSLSGLQNHVRSDHRFECKNCPLTFSMEKQLRQHNRIIHKKSGRQEVGSGGGGGDDQPGVVVSRSGGGDDQPEVVVSRVIGEHATHRICTVTKQGSNE